MRFRLALFVFALMAALPAFAQTKAPTRDQTRELLRGTLDRNAQAALHTTFRQSDKNPYNFVGQVTTGLKNARSLEVVIMVGDQQTINFRVYPFYGAGYINVDKARDSANLMRTLLQLSDTNFLFWGAEAGGDVFAGYTITLESGYPEEAMRTVLNSIGRLDEYVGRLRPSIDGSSAAP